MAYLAGLFTTYLLLSVPTLHALSFPSSQPSLSPATIKPIDSYSQTLGNSALQQVEWLGKRVSFKEDSSTWGDDGSDVITTRDYRSDATAKVDGTGGSIFQPGWKEIIENRTPGKQQQVWQALANLEQDMQLLDNIAGQRPQLSLFEATLLTGAVLSAFTSPLILGGHIAEFLAPSAAAFSAAIGIGAEYTGKVAVADGKEIAAASIQCAAEAEAFLANAERAKAITPLCVGLGATAASFALLVPVLLDTLGVGNLQLATTIYLLCPLISILAAAVASLALQETMMYSQRAIGIGTRRFSKSGTVGRTWLSSSEQVTRKSSDAAKKWKTFSISVLPAPVIGALIPGALPTKTIIVAAIAAAESAYFLTQCEAVLSRATDAVALKSRSAAVCDTYANQGARSAAILPFTSALASLCAAATAAIVELPFVESLLSAGTGLGIASSMVTVSIFPALSAIFAAAASVSKARCEVDAEAAMQAASTLAIEYDNSEKDPVLSPFKAVNELIKLALSNSFKGPLKQFFRNFSLTMQWRRFRTWIGRRGGSGPTTTTTTIDTNFANPSSV